MPAAARIFNLCEAGLWFAFALGMAVWFFRARGQRRKIAAQMCVAFIAFGISDLIEARTGGYWKPPALLFFKAACVAVLGLGLWQYWRLKAEEKLPSSQERDETSEG